MLTVLYAQKPQMYYRQPVIVHDIQILSLGNTYKIGHYVCIQYVSNERTLYVYDPLNSGNSVHAYVPVINQRYPQLQRIVYRTARTLQPDLFSCGVFSIAHATKIILGHDPTQYRLNLDSINAVDQSMPLREHSADMIEDGGQLTLFP